MRVDSNFILWAFRLRLLPHVEDQHAHPHAGPIVKTNNNINTKRVTSDKDNSHILKISSTFGAVQQRPSERVTKIKRFFLQNSKNFMNFLGADSRTLDNWAPGPTVQGPI